MTQKQFWMRLDQLFDTNKLTPEEKEDRAAQYLKTAYDEDLNLLGAFLIMEDDMHQLCVVRDDKHLKADNNGLLICYTSKNRAINDTEAITYGDNAAIAEAPVQTVLNNLFNKRSLAGLVFNKYIHDRAIIVRKSVLERYMPGEKPLPPGYKDGILPSSQSNTIK